uniref:CBS domain-containing protein n=1 Tax=Romanomermis culicivorax TaxID=13658 RepID=A0A915KWX5_ROMCU
MLEKCLNASANQMTTRCSGDEGFASSEDVNRPLYVDTKMANDWINALPPPLHDYCARRSMSISSDPFVLSKKIAAAGSASLTRQRQRRNSEFGRYFIMRKSTETGGMNEFVAQLEDNGEQAYCQLLCSMKCYDVMPTMSTVVVLDSTLPVSKGCAALVRNEVGAAIILESSRSSIIGILTVTDLLKTITNLRNISDPNEILNAPIFLQQQQQKDDDYSNGNSVSSSNRSSDVERDENDIGIMTIKPVYVFSDNNLYVVSKLLCERRLHRVVVYDSELNVDPLFLLSKRMILKALHKYGPGKLFTCHKRITLMLAVESMLHADAHRLIVVDSLGYLEAIISVSDLMRFLIANLLLLYKLKKTFSVQFTFLWIVRMRIRISCYIVPGVKKERNSVEFLRRFRRIRLFHSYNI